MVQSLYRFRWLLYELVLRDIVLRYRGSVLGFVWTILNPLLAMLVYTLVFSVFLRVPIAHYAVFLLAGLLPWLWFSGSITMGTTSIVDGRVYVSRSVFAPILLVLVPILSNAVNYLLSIALFFAIAAYFGVPAFGWPLLALPVVMGVQFLLTLGIVLMAATANVFFRDLQQLLVTVLSLLFYLAPIIYPIESVPEQFRALVVANPMASLVTSYQDILFYGRLPDGRSLALSFAISVALLVIGSRIFDRYKDSFADYA